MVNVWGLTEISEFGLSINQDPLNPESLGDKSVDNSGLRERQKIMLQMRLYLDTETVLIRKNQ